jgi:hypothetical protein
MGSLFQFTHQNSQDQFFSPSWLNGLIKFALQEIELVAEDQDF